MFNRDIKGAFSRMDTKPTEQFKNHLKARIIPDAAPRRTFHPFRVFTLAGATFVLVFGVFTFFSPANINRALASAIQNTFAFSADGYHHLKIEIGMIAQGSEDVHTTELWTDGTHAIIDYSNPTNTGSAYYDQAQGVQCDYRSPESIYDPHEPSCEAPQFLTEKMTNAHSTPTADMPIKEIAIESAADTHGDLYFTWTTDRPLSTTFASISSGPYGYETSTFNGMYSWQNEAGDTVNRVTWFSQDMLQSPFSSTPETSFLVQLKETAPDDVGYAGPYAGTPISQSKVYLVDTTSMTVTPVSDDWLDQSRKTFDDKMLASTVSTETIQREYESSFQYAIDIGNNLNTYARLSTDRTTVDGTALEVDVYDLSAADPFIIDTTAAAKAEFTREVDTNLIRDMKLYSADGAVIYHVQLKTFEELPSAPAGFFSKDAWTSHVEGLK